MKKNYRTKWRNKGELQFLAKEYQLTDVSLEKRLKTKYKDQIVEMAKGALYFINTEKSKFKKNQVTSPTLSGTLRNIYGSTYDEDKKAPDFRTLFKKNKQGEYSASDLRKMKNIIKATVLYSVNPLGGVKQAKLFMNEQRENLQKAYEQFEEDNYEVDEETGELIKVEQETPIWSKDDFKKYWRVYDENRDLFEEYESGETQLYVAEIMNKNFLSSEDELKAQINKIFKAGEDDRDLFKKNNLNKYKGMHGVGSKKITKDQLAEII